MSFLNTLSSSFPWYIRPYNRSSSFPPPFFQVVDRCDMNKMTAANLAVVFGPNLAWPNDKTMTLTSIGPVNAFTEYLFANMHEVFII